MMGTMMQDLAFAIPGVDEAMSFAEIMKYVTTTLCAPFSFFAHMVALTDFANPNKNKNNKRTGTSNRWNTL
jgi:hypothetical protein